MIIHRFFFGNIFWGLFSTLYVEISVLSSE